LRDLAFQRLVVFGSPEKSVDIAAKRRYFQR
jgi:hypothetical protein